MAKHKGKHKCDDRSNSMLHMHDKKNSNRKRKSESTTYEKYGKKKKDNSSQDSQPSTSRGYRNTMKASTVKRQTKLKSSSLVKESCPSSSKCQPEEIEIPGFYFDPDKKKYFKILSSNNSVNVVTKEKIAENKAEKKRIKDLANLAASTPARTKAKLKQQSSNFVHLILRHERGDVNVSTLENKMLLSGIERLKPAGSWSLFPTPFGDHERLEHMTLLDSNTEKDKILGLWSVKETIMQRIQLLHLCQGNRSEGSPSLSLDVRSTDTTVIQTWNKITNICWAPFARYPERNNILYTTMCHTGYSFSLACIRNIDKRRCQDAFYDFNLGTRTTWTCAWNTHKEQFSIGSERKILLIDVETRRMWEFPCCSDPFVQTFCKKNVDCLYSGARNGMILCHDLRCSSSRPLTFTNHKTSVASIKLTSCGNNLLSCDISGKVNLWDVRKQRVVREYTGLFNKYSRLPIHFDDTEQILYAVGQDSYTRFWCRKTGKLLQNLPPPCPTARETIPVVQYSTRWAGAGGNAGLVMGLGDKLYFYSGFS